MNKTVRITLIFVAVLAVLLGLAALVEHAVGGRSVPDADEAPAKAEVYNEYNESGAAVISLMGDTAQVQGLGAQVKGNVVTIKYPGTYRVEGALAGQLAVDLGEYTGAVYILMNGASITCADGPALYVIQSDRTTVRLAEGTQNALTDGESYTIFSNGEYHTGAALYSSDDLVIDGAGSLTVNGSSADGIRVKDSLSIEGGSLNITGADDGIQVNDGVEISDGSLLIGSGGDGISVTRGGMTVSGGYLWVNSSGDALSAATALSITGGSVNVTACGGSLMYPYVALNDLSAKGLKAATVTISGGIIDLDTADDAIHAAGDVAISGGSFTLASGDDAIHADNLLDIRNVAVDVTACYEGLEANEIRLGNIWIRIYAENNGVDAGEEGFVMDDGILILDAPRAIGSQGALAVNGGTVTVTSDGTDSPLSFTSATVAGGFSAYIASSNAPTILANGEIPYSLLFVLPTDVASGTTVTLWSPAGEALYTHETTGFGGSFLYAGSPLAAGQTYTLTAGDYTYAATLTDGCTVTPEEALTVQASQSASGEGPQRSASGEASSAREEREDDTAAPANDGDAAATPVPTASALVAPGTAS